MRRWLPDKALLWNVGLVYVLQGSNFLLGLITAPYLTRALGVEGYGAFTYCMSANTFVWILIDWGYGVGAMREVALVRSDPDGLTRTFWRAMSGRLTMLAPALVLLLALAFGSNANPPWVVLLSGALTALGAVMACDWFVMGVERMGVYLITSVGARALTFALTVLVVRTPADSHIASIIHGVGGIFAGASGLVAVLCLYRMKPVRLQLREGALQIWEFRHYFISRSNALLYASAAPVVLGVVAAPAALGMYAGADKIVKTCILVVTPLSVALGARINAAIADSRDRAAGFSGRVVAIYLAFTIPMSLLLLAFPEPILALAFGSQFRSAAGVIRLLSPIPLLMGLSGVLASQYLVPLGRANALSRVSLISSLLYCVSLVGLSLMLGASGAAIAFVLAEACLVGGFLFVLVRSERAYLVKSFTGLLKGP